jgi:hypothetical protein
MRHDVSDQGGTVMKIVTLFLASALIALAIPSTAARPSGPGLTNPQIAFVKSSTSGRRQLIIANEDGSGATAIYTTNQLVRVEMGSDGMVYFTDGPRFGRIPVAGGSPQWLFEVSSRLGGNMDLSPDGSSLAWWDSANGTLNRYHIGTGQQQLVTPAPELLDLSFDRTGANIIFNVAVGNGNYEFMIVPATGGTAIPYGLSGPFTNFDASHQDSTLVVTIQPPATAPVLGLWEPGMSGPVSLVPGYNGTYRCDDSAIMYQRVVGGGSTIFRRSSSGVITTIAKPESVFPSYKQQGC